MSKKNMFNQYVIPPGETIKELLEVNGMKEIDLANKTGMKTSNDVIDVHTNPKDKEDAIIKGLNMTSKQVIPFEVVNPLYSNELENALKESVIIENEYKEGKRKGYNNANEMMKSILND